MALIASVNTGKKTSPAEFNPYDQAPAGRKQKVSIDVLKKVFVDRDSPPGRI